ncbi:hypothetical protein DPEC_G00216460 [Dallia pectoralis]|uniref:Uncharacterized protein n=1 Tax=Dallia pectoralis TaxID=75939 RepID=A0ACC2G2P7_DALPE|nr:hypothetical protein DPEC_G00216460 [Dallia pectoralis]
MMSRAIFQWTSTIIVILLFVESNSQRMKLYPNRWGPQSMMYLKGKYGTRDVADYQDNVQKSVGNGLYTLINGFQRLRSLNVRKHIQLRKMFPLLGVLKMDTLRLK